jgi:serine/threonine protein kinase
MNSCTDNQKRLGQEAANTFVLKEYSTADAEIYYDNETAAFNTIGSNSHIISYYGSFTKNGTFNVVLEHADKGTLKDFFEKQLAPTSGPKIIKFWQGLFNLLDALRSIHSVEPFASGPQIFQG